MVKVVDPCFDCGRSTVFGTGRFVNRIPYDCTPNEDTHTDLVVVGGWYCCAECDEIFEKEFLEETKFSKGVTI